MDNQTNYGKRPLWQWVLIYAIIGLVIYGLIYYFVLAKKEEQSAPVPAPAAPSATSDSSPSATESNLEIVILKADGFSPADLIIKAGTEVKWINQSGAAATVNSNPHPSHTDYQALNLGSLSDKGTVSLIFDQAGTYKYHDHLKPSQSGTIIVQ